MYRDDGRVKGYLRAEGQRIVNGDGQELLLRGVGLGNWLLPEGYMWKFPPTNADRPRRIEKLVTDLIGESAAKEFWVTFRERFITEDDVRQIAAEGLNSIRLPINARWLLEEGDPVRFNPDTLALIDRFIGWCKKYSLYVILDLHGAPGGQTGANIDDSEHDQPELFTNEDYWRRTVELWRMLAERYKDEWIVGGYDLLNEPLPEWFNMHNDKLMPLYKEITAAIREVDDKHMIIIEGAHWATDWSMFTAEEMFDDNLLLQFHKYWSSPDQEGIAPYLEKREMLNMPIYMGEGGENSLGWYAGAFGLYEDHHISWNFWTWKKLDTANSPCSIRRPHHWDLILNYVEGSGEKPDQAASAAILNEYLDNILIGNCDYLPSVLRAVQRKLPLRMPAEHYGHRGQDISWGVAADSERITELCSCQRTEQAGLGASTSKEQPNVFRPGDGIRVGFLMAQEGTPNYHLKPEEEWNEEHRLCVTLTAGDWVAYPFLCESPAAYTLQIKLRALTESADEGTHEGIDEIAELVVHTDRDRHQTINVSSQDWSIISAGQQTIPASGEFELKIEVISGTIVIDWLEWLPVNDF
ncbi:cellulase family glycosylhydrolase [Paenibacillus woosongensis]|uniref:Cellulase family glycosylhydrolase n=1 Tax=Paenibacillus woosongensis TaxID=307580 RepID=A0AA95IAZ8_9BACL|nr:cellulase family glycosylhydrolase [Paenibacillus woosongensis]WHX48678.1 cellulase family glycosylhydrolase [Paenibacillus woosongensis]